jgi:nucleotide-binding universal stress UspA family protein
MLDKIAVLLDGSALSQRVLPHTRTMAHAFGAEVTLLHVLEPPNKADIGFLDTVDWHLRKVEAQSFLNTVSRQEERQLQPNTVLLEGNAANRIIEYIEESRPALVMLSSHGESGLSPWNVSSVAQKVIYRAFSSVMLVRAYQQHEEFMTEVRYRRIAVLLDGSKRAEYVLPFANQLAHVQETDILLIHALPPAMAPSHTLTQEETAAIEQLNKINSEKGNHYLEQMAAKVNANVQTCCLPALNTADTLIKFVDSNDIDLVIVSAHGQSSQTTRPYGSIVSNFIAYGSTTLLIIQDLPQAQIRPTRAEISAAAQTNNEPIRMNRAHAYAQPADWSTN